MANRINLFFASAIFFAPAFSYAQQISSNIQILGKTGQKIEHVADQTVNGFAVNRSLQQFGVVYGLKPADKDLSVCQASVAIYLDKFIQSVPEFEAKNILSENLSAQDAYKHKYNLMMEFSLKFIQTLIPKAFSLKNPANLCSFSSSFIWSKDGKKHNMTIVSFSIAKSIYDHIDWNKINYTDIPSVSLNYYTSPIYYEQMTKEDQGFWK
ncbi:hypothetical protein ACU81Q_14650 [Komagataeibacter melomenusus]